MKKLLLFSIIFIAVSTINLTAQTTANLLTKNSISSAEVDSVVFGFTSANITIINDAAATDTMFISLSSAFTDSATFVRTGGEGMSVPLTVDKIYYKFGSTPTAGKPSRIEVSRWLKY